MKQQVRCITGVHGPATETCEVVFVLSCCEMIPSMFWERQKKEILWVSILKGWKCQILTLFSLFTLRKNSWVQGISSGHCVVLTSERNDMGKLKLLTLHAPFLISVFHQAAVTTHLDSEFHRDILVCLWLLN